MATLRVRKVSFQRRKEDGFKIIKRKRKVKSKNLKVETIYDTQLNFRREQIFLPWLLICPNKMNVILLLLRKVTVPFVKHLKTCTAFLKWYSIGRKLEKAIGEFESSQFCFEFLKIIDFCLTSLSENSVNEILCYGIGSFSESKSSLHQLAALVRICKNYDSNVVLYDPVLTEFEIQILEELNFAILLDNEEGKRKILENQVTLVFLPHCPKQLINNFIWANWNTSLCRCILIANSFSKIIQENTTKELNKTANYILKIHLKTKEISLEEYNIENIFNDISVHYFPSQELDINFFSKTLEEEPVYLEDTEFITKSLKNFVIKNE